MGNLPSMNLVTLPRRHVGAARGRAGKADIDEWTDDSCGGNNQQHLRTSWRNGAAASNGCKRASVDARYALLRMMSLQPAVWLRTFLFTVNQSRFGQSSCFMALSSSHAPFCLQIFFLRE